MSSSFPNTTFRLLTGVPTDERSLELGEVVGENAAAAADAIRAHADVIEYELLFADDRRALARYETTEQRLYGFLGDSSVPPEFPVVVENGAMEFDLTATRETFEAVVETLEANGFRYELLSLVHGERPAEMLTERQRECLAVAFREGYFEVPRRATLAEVAESLGVDKSTASETIRRGSARVMEWFLVAA